MVLLEHVKNALEFAWSFFAHHDRFCNVNSIDILFYMHNITTIVAIMDTFAAKIHHYICFSFDLNSL